MNRNHPHLLLGLAVVFVLQRCGGDEAERSSAAGVQASAPRAEASTLTSEGVDPCALVTRAEAEEALGGPVAESERPPEANMPPQMVTCRYVAQRGQAVAVMTVMVRMSDSEGGARSGYASQKEQFPGAEAVAGIGDDAFWFGNQLNILQGKTNVIIGGDFDLERAKALGQRALERIR